MAKTKPFSDDFETPRRALKAIEHVFTRNTKRDVRKRLVLADYVLEQGDAYESQADEQPVVVSLMHAPAFDLLRTNRHLVDRRHGRGHDPPVQSVDFDQVPAFVFQGPDLFDDHAGDQRLRGFPFARHRLLIFPWGNI